MVRTFVRKVKVKNLSRVKRVDGNEENIYAEWTDQLFERQWMILKNEVLATRNILIRLIRMVAKPRRLRK